MKILKVFICILSVKCQTEENGTEEILEAPPIPSTTGMIFNSNGSRYFWGFELGTG